MDGYMDETKNATQKLQTKQEYKTLVALENTLLVMQSLTLTFLI